MNLIYTKITNNATRETNNEKVKIQKRHTRHTLLVIKKTYETEQKTEQTSTQERKNTRNT